MFDEYNGSMETINTDTNMIRQIHAMTNPNESGPSVTQPRGIPLCL